MALLVPGDRVRLPDGGQHGIIEEIDGGTLAVYWGTSDGNRVVTRHEPNELRAVASYDYPCADPTSDGHG